MKIISVKEFESLIKKSNEKMFFRFYADWCPYCKNSQQETIDVISKYKKNNIYFVDVKNENVWAEDGNTSVKLNLIPTQRIYQNKKVIWEFENVMTREELEKVIAKF